MIKNMLVAGFGGFVGTILRFLSYQIYKPLHPFWITLCVNVLGSFLIGVLFGLGSKNISFNSYWKIFFVTGICGGFTTFSAFSMENIQLIQQGKLFLSLLYIITSLIAGIGAAFIGLKLAA